MVLGAMVLLSAMGLALVLLAMSQTLAAWNERRANTALYAAEAGLERALPDLLKAPEWDSVLDGRVRSGFTDGSPGGTRELPGGVRVDLDQVVALANCGAVVACSDSQITAVTRERPWGPNNPRWRLFAYGPLAGLVPDGGLLPPAEYVVVLVADDPAEADSDPLRDGRPGTSAGAGVVQLRAEAFGPDAAHRAIEVMVARGGAGAETAGYAAQRGQGSIGGRSAATAVQVPGSALTRSEMTMEGGFTRR